MNSSYASYDDVTNRLVCLAKATIRLNLFCPHVDIHFFCYNFSYLWTSLIDEIVCQWTLVRYVQVLVLEREEHCPLRSCYGCYGTSTRNQGTLRQELGRSFLHNVYLDVMYECPMSTHDKCSVLFATLYHFLSHLHYQLGPLAYAVCLRIDLPVFNLIYSSIILANAGRPCVVFCLRGRLSQYIVNAFQPSWENNVLQ